MKPKKPIESLILTLRGQKVILDADLAELYGVPTKAFNQAVKRNADRFPQDFLFQLTTQEWNNLKSQFVTSSLEVAQPEGVLPNWSQFVTSSKRHRGAAYRPNAFTEHGRDDFEQSRSRGDERFCGARVHADARATRGKRRDPQAAGGD